MYLIRGPPEQLPDVGEETVLDGDEGATSKVWMLVLRASLSQEPASPYSSTPWYSWL